MPIHPARITVAFLLALSPTLIAQSPIPVRELGAMEATSTERVGFVNGIRELSDGHVLVNDAGRHRLLLFDTGLSSVPVVADTSSTAGTRYGPRATTIISFTGDSTLLVDGVGRAFLVLDPSGATTRVMAAPRPNDVTGMMGSGLGAAASDGKGRLIYRSMIMPTFKAPVVGKPYTPPVIADSAPLIRADFETRAADTIAWVRVARIKVNTMFLPNGGVTLTPVFSPLSIIDDWTVLPDGSVAILRGSDYHLDWIDSNGTRASSPRLPFDWKRLSDDGKVAVIDSARKALEGQAKLGSNAASAAALGPGGHGGGSTIPSGHSMTIMPIGGEDGAPPPQSANKGPTLPVVAELVEPSDLPDYYPPILQSGEMRADFNGNVWILPATTAQAGRGLVYDIVNRQGVLFERVRLPLGRALEGFGHDGAVYMTSHGSDGARLEKARIRR